jgi:hypothetical protein
MTFLVLFLGNGPFFFPPLLVYEREEDTQDFLIELALSPISDMWTRTSLREKGEGLKEVVLHPEVKKVRDIVHIQCSGSSFGVGARL